MKCPHCERKMQWLPWKTKAGGRYLCECGFKFWMSRCGKRLLPQFHPARWYKGSGADAVTPPPPGEIEIRKKVIRRWNLLRGIRPQDRYAHKQRI